jgi:prolyl oligopeptidase
MPKVTRSSIFALILSGSILPLGTVSAAAAPVAGAAHKVNSMTEYTATGQTDNDHLYLEEVLGEKALAQVKTWNDRTLSRLTSDPRFAKMEGDALTILNSKDKIPYVSYRGGEVHNFWQDAQHVRGIWRKTTLDSYLTPQPEWETVLDIDALAKAEGKNWVYKGNACLPPAYDVCMVTLSDGGKDASVQREFNVRTKTFVKDGFATRETKGGSVWLDKDTQIAGVDFGAGTMTESGYPMTARLWKRGQPLDSAQEFIRGEAADVAMSSNVTERADGSHEIIMARARTFYETDYFWVPRKDGILQKPVSIPVPGKSNLGAEFKGQMLLTLNEDWREFKSGDLVSFTFDDFMKSGKIAKVHLVTSQHLRGFPLNGYGITKSVLLVGIMRDVVGDVEEYGWDDETGWTPRARAVAPDQAGSFPKSNEFPENGALSIGATNDKEDIAFISSESFLMPSSLWTYNTATGEKLKAKSLPDWFDTGNMVADQFFSTSKDGTQVPYFVVRSKATKLDGTNPTLLYGYGGFEISLNPSYSATRGKLWLEQGGVYVLANIRGGGEYGPAWHQAGLKTNRQRIYDDFISVAEDLIAKKLTSPKHLGIEGGSNGGLLMGVMFTQRPDLFNAVVCAVPLLDMLRYDKLLAGASWVGEYGSPADPAEGAFLRGISPYHNIKQAAKYPEVFFVTSTKDDRVHPAHARKMAQRMQDQGHAFLYYENIDGGHSAAANLKETAKRLALQHTYLMQKLKDGK